MRTLIVLFAIVLLSASAEASHLRNESMKVQGNSVIITYDLDGAKKVPVILKITAGGRTYSHHNLHMDGDVGEVSPGPGKRIVWNVLMDFPKGLHEDIEAELVAQGDFIEMGFVQGGCFEMGCGKWSGPCEPGETPPHRVCLSDFNIGRHEVTQRQWREIMGSNPSMNPSCDDCPVENVSWLDVQEFISKLNRKEGLKYRLPTEAEWEYVARGLGLRQRWSGTDDDSGLENYAWLSFNAMAQTHPIGLKAPNAIGIYDMTGNVWEMCSDWYQEDYYSHSPKDRPSGPSHGSRRVARGGSFYIGPSGARSTFRSGIETGYMSADLGFRLARTR